MSKDWKFEKTMKYYPDIAMRESSNKPAEENGSHLGLYQMGKKGALIDTDYIDKDTKEWTGKNGVKSKEDFFKMPKAQDIAIREYHKIIWERYLKNYHQYEGQIVGGINMTKSGMISAAHLVGHDKLKDYIKSNGKINPKDKLNTECKEYLAGFANYEVDYTITPQLRGA